MPYAHRDSPREPTAHFPYVVLEGGDGAGKTTIRREIAKHLVLRGIPVLEIGQHSWLNLLAARVILDAREQRAHFTPEAVREAYERDKWEHEVANVRPHLSRALVLADRSIISDAVYQEALYGM